MKAYVAMLVTGILLMLGPIWGRVGTIVGMVRAFGHLGESEPEATALANDISSALHTTMIGCAVGLGGYITLAPYQGHNPLRHSK